MNTIIPTTNPEVPMTEETGGNPPSSENTITSPLPFKRPGGDRPRLGGNRARNNRPPRSMVGPKFDTTVTGKRETDHIPLLKDGDIRVIHLGGVEEIGRNMSLVEYKDTIIIVDCGIQFTETSTPVLLRCDRGAHG